MSKRKRVKRRRLPAASLQGDHRGTCIVCFKPTDTGLGFRDDAEWCIAGLQTLGVAEAHETAWHAWKQHDPTLLEGQVPGGTTEVTVREATAGWSGSRAPVTDAGEGPGPLSGRQHQLQAIVQGVVDTVVVLSDRVESRVRALALDVPVVRLRQPIDQQWFAWMSHTQGEAT